MKKLISKTTQLLIILLFISSIFIFFLVLQTRVNREIIEKINVEEITLTDQSKETAEAKNLAQVRRNTNPDLQLGKIRNNNTVQQNTSRDLDFRVALQLQPDITIKENSQLDNSFIPVLTADYEIISQLKDQDYAASLLNSIQKIISQNNLTSLAISKEFTKLNGFFNFLQSIQQLRGDTKIYLFLYPRWGVEPNYRYFFQIDNPLQSNFTPFQISQQVDFLVLPTFGFTNEFSILPYKISDFELVERMLQFHIAQRVPTSQLMLHTTQNSYIWPKREIPTTYHENYSWFESQAIINSATNFSNLLLIQDIDGNEFFSTQIDQQDSIVVKISSDLQERFKNLAIDYGLYGLITD